MSEDNVNATNNRTKCLSWSDSHHANKGDHGRAAAQISRAIPSTNEQRTAATSSAGAVVAHFKLTQPLGDPSGSSF